MSRKTWTEADDAQIRARFPHEASRALAAAMGCSLGALNSRANQLRVRKSPEYIAQLLADAGERMKRDGMRTRIAPGTAPWNKGVPFRAGGRSAETRFKPGRPPSANANYLPIGSLRISDGYLQRKVTDDRSIVPANRWKGVHRLVWIEAHGPVPDGYVVAFKPGRRTTVESEITLDALELVSRAEIQRRNSIHRLPPEVAHLCQLRGALNRKINRKEKELRHAQQDV